MVNFNFNQFNQFDLSVNTDNLEAIQCSMDFIHFLRYVKTTTVDGKVVSIPLDWPYIIKLSKMLMHEKRLVVLKGRQMLCSWIIVAYAVWACLNQENLIILILSKGEKPAQEMIRRAYELYDRLPSFLKNIIPLRDGPRNMEKVEFNNRSRIISLPSKGDAPRTVSAKIVFIDEAAYARELDEMLGAIEPALGEESKLFIVSTPNGKPIGRSFTKLCKEAENKGYRRFDLHYRLCPAYRNPEWEQQKRRSMTQAKFAHEYELSLASSGDSMIFAKLSEKNDWEGSFVPNENYVLMRCVDPGEKMGVIWIAEDILGNIIAYRESYLHGGSYERRAQAILRKSPDNELYDCSVIDSAAPDAKRELGKHGIYCRSCIKKDVHETIDQINTLIEGNGLDTPCLFITDDCPKLKEQMQSWVGDDCGYPVKNQYDHGIDALRYGVQIRFKIRKNKSQGFITEQAQSDLNIDKDFEIEISSDTISRGDGIDHNRDFSETDFDLGWI